MPNKLHIAAAVITTLALTEIYRVKPLRSALKNTKSAALLFSDIAEARSEQLTYLLKVLEEKDVELDEFDLIMLNDFNTQKQD